HHDLDQLRGWFLPVGIDDRVTGCDGPPLRHVAEHTSSGDLLRRLAARPRRTPESRSRLGVSCAGVAELVYAPGLGPGGRKPLGVRIPPPAYRRSTHVRA